MHAWMWCWNPRLQHWRRCLLCLVWVTTAADGGGRTWRRRCREDENTACAFVNLKGESLKTDREFVNLINLLLLKKKTLLVCSSTAIEKEVFVNLTTKIWRKHILLLLLRERLRKLRVFKTTLLKWLPQAFKMVKIWTFIFPGVVETCYRRLLDMYILYFKLC